MPDKGKLDGKVALVTGASPNIGGVLASGLAAAGARVACNDLHADVASARAQEIEKAGGEAMALPFDVTDAASVQKAVASVVERFGKIDILVNNAVKFDQAGLLDMTVERFQQMIDIILIGSFTVSQAVAKAMIANGTRGSIVNILSGAAWQGQSGNIGYTTGKSGLVNFTRAAAMDLAPHGIRVNALTPTVTEPEDPVLAAKFQERMKEIDAEGRLSFTKFHPWDRFPKPSDYVAPLVFLVSDDAELMTGGNISVDGGSLAKYWPDIPRHGAKP